MYCFCPKIWYIFEKGSNETIELKLHFMKISVIRNYMLD